MEDNMQSYVYIIKEIGTNRKYVGCQYNKKANPTDLFSKYFTSNKLIKDNPSNYIIEKISINKNARELERRYLRYIYYKLGKHEFLRLYINRNLAPGIIHDADECNRISNRMKDLWKTEERKNKHKLDMEKRIQEGFYEKRRGIDPFSDKTKEIFRNNMLENNPMFNEETKQKHKEKMNTPEIKGKRKLLSTGNTYVKGRKWYNNGIISKMFKEEPNLSEGWIEGRLNPHWNQNRKNNG